MPGSGGPFRDHGHAVFAALYGYVAASIEAGPVGAARQALLSDAYGVVVDLGAGTGVNAQYLGDQVSAIHLVEPDPHMRRRLRLESDPRLQIHPVGAEHLPLGDGTVDTVLATLTLCTVGDPQRAVQEIRRVLRANGQLLVLEHVRSLDPWLARWQSRLARPWSWMFAGCMPDRDTAALLAGAGFDTSTLCRLTVRDMPVAREWITGRLAAPSS
jgi:SAM-dependent methyltransferase